MAPPFAIQHLDTYKGLVLGEYASQTLYNFNFATLYVNFDNLNLCITSGNLRYEIVTPQYAEFTLSTAFPDDARAKIFLGNHIQEASPFARSQCAAMYRRIVYLACVKIGLQYY